MRKLKAIISAVCLILYVPFLVSELRSQNHKAERDFQKGKRLTVLLKKEVMPPDIKGLRIKRPRKDMKRRLSEVLTERF